jgi:hypothetical protein
MKEFDFFIVMAAIICLSLVTLNYKINERITALENEVAK